MDRRAAPRDPGKARAATPASDPRRGRLGDALVTEAEENLLYYSYSIRGVQYTASQDVSSLRDRLPEDLGRVVGPATMKYTPANPANSILFV